MAQQPAFPMLLDLLPTRYLITRAARAYGFMDPISLMAKLRSFAQPSEVGEPIELLRAGVVFHARGLVNTKAIQNNLDWVWPYWVERQFNPADDSFIPRAFSFSHINLTHRNWTAVGLPDVGYYPIVDPRGLVTPLYNGWSLDFWFVPAEGPVLLPSKLEAFQQSLECSAEKLEVSSLAQWPQAVIASRVGMELVAGAPVCRIDVSLPGGEAGWLAVALRPYNPEGISFVDRVGLLDAEPGWRVNGRNPVKFDRRPFRQVLSTYQDGDAIQRRDEAGGAESVSCPVGMATALALFPAEEIRERPLQVCVPIFDDFEPKRQPVFAVTPGWSTALAPLARLSLADGAIQRLYDLALSTLVLLTPGEVYPGPYTYKRFWFRDAAFILNALLSVGGVGRTRRALAEFAPRQRRDGYFLSQEGEWDANGEALWMYHRFAALTGETLPEEWMEAVRKGARWIGKKRLPRDAKSPGAGLFPAGFSAEHLGPNDFYYWDDFWGVAGLRCAAELVAATEPALAAQWRREADDFFAVIERSVPSGPHRRFPGAIPAAPTRRMDSGAVGSLVADYPLQLVAPADERMVRTAKYLGEYSSHAGGFFQHMIHSGINPYLTMHLAQVWLRAGEPERAWALIDCVLRTASPTGQWPEAVHPRTGGGCMGDGQHTWAAAEWVMLVRNCFVREEGGGLVIAAGVRPEWWRYMPASLGPVLTPHGPVTVQVAATSGGAMVWVQGEWRAGPPRLRVCLPGFSPQECVPAGTKAGFQLTFVA